MSRRPVRVPGAAPGPVHWTEALAELHRWATPAMTAGELAAIEAGTGKHSVAADRPDDGDERGAGE